MSRQLRILASAIIVAAVSLAIYGCNGDPPPPKVSPPPQLSPLPTLSPPPKLSPPPTMTVPPKVTLPPVLSPPPKAAPGSPAITVLAENLDTPWAAAFAPDGRMFVTERGGQVRILENGRLQAEPWMSLPVTEQSESGLMGLAIDPQFASNRFVYVAYTSSSDNRLVRLKEDTQSRKGAVDKVLLDGIRAAGVHDGGRVKFGPDGKLYLTMGEAGAPDLAQDKSSLNGKILRLNPDGSVPQDNPFPGSPVYSWGHRNPQGLAWQPGTGRLYATEHGPSGGPAAGQDEVNYIEPAKNYGWPTITGDRRQEGMESPVVQSGILETWAPAGATFVTRGAWAGSFLFTGLRGEALYRLVLDTVDPRKVISREKLFSGQFGRLRDVVEGPDGAIYILTSNRDGRGRPQPGDDRILKLTVP